MKNLSFPQKNDLVVKHKSKKYFSKDLELFQKHFLSNRLLNDLARANEFTFEKLDGQMLYLLLDKVSIDEILKNRIPSIEETPVSPILLDLDKVSIDEILKNRIPSIEETPLSPILLDDELGGFVNVDENETPITPVVGTVAASSDEILKELSSRIDALEESAEINEDEISDFRLEMENKDALIEDLKSKIEALENKASKKKDETGGVPPDSVE